MKSILLHILLTISFIPMNSEPIIGSYAIKSDNNFSIIEIKPDSTFLYKNRGISTWTWHTFEGTWTYSENTLTLKEKHSAFDINKYLVEFDKAVLNEKNRKFNFRYHQYQVIKNQLIAFPENHLDANMEFSKL